MKSPDVPFRVRRHPFPGAQAVQLAVTAPAGQKRAPIDMIPGPRPAQVIELAHQQADLQRLALAALPAAQVPFPLVALLPFGVDTVIVIGWRRYPPLLGDLGMPLALLGD